jgi:hypothetical protein
MGISNTHGSITVGKSKFIITKPIPSYYQLPYAFGSNLDVFLEGYHYKKRGAIRLLFFYLNVFYSKTKLETI